MKWIRAWFGPVGVYDIMGDGEAVRPVDRPASAPSGEGANRAVKPCPFCSETIDARARKCRFCNEWLNRIPVHFRQGKERIWGASFAEIRHGDGYLSVDADGLTIAGMSQPALALVSTRLEASQTEIHLPGSEVDSAVYEPDTRRLRVGHRPAGAWIVRWYECTSDQMEQARTDLREVLGPERYVERNSWENRALAQDLGIAWGLVALFLPVPLLGFLISLPALFFGIRGAVRARTPLSWVGLTLTLGAVALDAWVLYLVSH